METSRLELRELKLSDSNFILELLNTPKWIRFIGDRNIRTPEDAIAYTQKVISNSTITYWVIYLKSQAVPAGIISLVKRDYLQHPDIGFALLPEFENQGYASEATKFILDHLAQSKLYSKIQAITVKDNAQSIQLLQKLGFQFDTELERDKEKLLVFSMELM